jgi:hypothetical protein
MWLVLILAHLLEWHLRDAILHTPRASQLGQALAIDTTRHDTTRRDQPKRAHLRAKGHPGPKAEHRHCKEGRGVSAGMRRSETPEPRERASRHTRHPTPERRSAHTLEAGAA